jgi:hypothetical protein
MSSADVFSEDFNKSDTQWETPNQGWQIANGRAEIIGNQGSAESYLISPPFVVPKGEFKLKYKEKYSLESHHDFGSVWITTDDGANWRKLHTVTGVTDWRDTYIDLRAYQNKTVKFAFTSKGDDPANKLLWQIDDIEIVEQSETTFTRPTNNARVSALAQQLQNSLNVILTGRETNTFPAISATVRVEDIPNLTQADFTVCENGEEQPNYGVIPPTDSTARPADIVFIVDNSASMDPFQLAIQNSVTDFVNDLFDAEIDAALGLTRFGQAGGGFPIVEESGTLFTDPNVYLTSIFSRNVDNGSVEPGLDAILESISEFNFRPNSQKIFILLTNEDNDGPTEPEDVLPVLQQQVITLYSVINVTTFIAGNSQSDYGDLATDSGGDQYDIADLIDPATLQPIIDDIESNIATNDTYIISYESSNPTLDGVERVVDIKVTTGGESDTVTFSYTPGAAPLIGLAQSTLDLIANPQPLNTSITIQANITDFEEPFTESATLFYRTTGQVTYAEAEMMNVSGDLWEATIPASFANMPGVDFYITATDGISTTSDRANSPAQNPYQIAINPNVAPVIVSTPINSLNPGEDLMIMATITDNTDEVASVSIFYRGVGEPLYQEVPLNNSSDNTYEATVDASDLSQNGVQYYIRATDNFGISSYFGEPQDPIEVEINTSPRIPDSLTLNPETVTVQAGVEVCITGTVFDQFGDPLPGVEIFTEIDGQVVGSGTSDENGEVVYCFTPTESGVVSVVCYYTGGERVTAEVTVLVPSLSIDVSIANGQVTVECTVVDQFGDPFPGETITIDVSGANAYNDSGETNAQGIVTFVYSATNTGTDLIVCSYSQGEESEEIVIPGDGSGDDTEVTSFTLVNAESDQDIQPLMNGDVVYSDGMTLLSIRANTDPSQVGSVRLELIGPLGRIQLENLSFYSLFGDSPRGDYDGVVFPSGEYTLTATPYSKRNAGGDAGDPLTIQFEIINITVDSFTLVSAETDQDIGSLNDGDIIDLSTVGETRLDVRANTTPDNLGSVRFELDGPVSTDRFENLVFYSLFGDNPRGDYQGEILLPGQYTLTATPFAERRGNGFEGAPLTIQFEVVGQPSFSVQSFTLVNAETNQDISSLNDGDIIDLAALGNILLSARATTSPGFIGSIIMELDGPVMHQQLENRLPYSLFGDNPPGEYSGRMLSPGQYTLTATPYSDMSGQGFTGTPLTITFTVVDGSSSRTAVVQSKIVQDSFSELSFSGDVNQEFVVYPTPSSGIIHILVPEQINNSAQLLIYDALGRVVHSAKNSKQTSLDLRSHGVGVYFVRLLDSDNIYTKRILIE